MENWDLNSDLSKTSSMHAGSFLSIRLFEVSRLAEKQVLECIIYFINHCYIPFINLMYVCGNNELIASVNVFTNR